jgi:hypothetical protein
VFGCVLLRAQCPSLQSKCHHCILHPVSFGVCYLIVGTMSLDIYIYIMCPVAMLRIFELLQIVDKKDKNSYIKINISILSFFP